MVIPIEDGLLYVEPLYLQAERSQLPELKRVIVASGPRIVMAPTLEEALAGLFGGRPPSPAAPAAATPTAPGGSAPTDAAARALADEALAIYRGAQERLRAGDLQGYSREIERLGPILERLRAITQPK